MAKIALHLAIFALVLVLANAFHTTITVQNPWGPPSGGCDEQIRDQNYLHHCQQYFVESHSGSGRGDFDNRPDRSHHLDDCCEQLENVDRKCRCPGLEHVLEQVPRRIQRRGETPQVSQIMDRIMSKCELEPRRCGGWSIDRNPSWRPRGDSCEEQIKEQNNLHHCQLYLEESFDNRPDRSQHLHDCCEQLENVERKCRCPGLRQVLQQQSEGLWRMMVRVRRGGAGHVSSQEVERILSKCELEPRRCETPFRNWV